MTDHDNIYSLPGIEPHWLDAHDAVPRDGPAVMVTATEPADQPRGGWVELTGDELQLRRDIADAVGPAAVASGEWAISRGSPPGTGMAGEAWGRASRSPASAACRSPSSESGVSACPWNRPSRIHSDSPWRSRTSVASSPSGISGASSGPLTGARPGAPPTRRSRTRRP